MPRDERNRKSQLDAVLPGAPGQTAAKSPDGFKLGAQTAAQYLRGERRVSGDVRCQELGGGVSNSVVLVEAPDKRFVLKQALSQLRVKDEWLADRSRIFRERDALVDAARLLPSGWVPRVLWSDEVNFLFAMEAVTEEAEPWKSRLLRGLIEVEYARRAGVALGLTIRGSWRSEEFRAKYGDVTAFHQLRTDPYYRTIARRNPDIAEDMAAWLLETDGRRLALTHGDWSPKNMMVEGGRMIFIDYECAHFGDPAFDVAFGLSHLVLKAFRRAEQASAYLDLARVFFTSVLTRLLSETLKDIERATARHLGFLLLARIDGKSPVEYIYITEDKLRDKVRTAAKRIIKSRLTSIDECLAIVAVAQ